MKKICLLANSKEPAEKGFYQKDYSDKLKTWSGNVGVLIGDTAVVLDVDPRNGGLESLEKLANIVSDTYTVETPSGGLHFYYAKSADLKLRTNRDYPGIDIKTGPKQYVVCPPSTINGKPYFIKKDIPLAVLPQAIVDIFEASQGESAIHSEEPWDLEKLRFYLFQLNTTEFADHDSWLRVMCACHEASEGDIEARDLFIEWSVLDPTYDTVANRKEIATRWASLRKVGSAITRKSLLYLVPNTDYKKDYEGIEGLSIEQALAKINYVKDDELRDELLERVKVAHNKRIGKEEKPKAEKNIKKTSKKKSLHELALILADKYRHSILYSTVDETFWVFTGQIWEQKHDRIIEQKLLDLLCDEALGAEYKITSQRIAAKELLDYAKTLLASEFSFWLSSQKDSENYVPCESGVLFLKDSKIEVRDYSSELMLSSKFKFNYLPAVERNTKQFDELLDVIIPEATDFIYELFGYSLLRQKRIPLVTVFQGAGKNGKTTIANILSNWLGMEKTAAIDLEQLDRDKHAYSNLVGKYLAIDDDVNKSARIPDGTLKKLSESKLLEANPKGKPAYLFMNTALLLLLSNHTLHSWDLSHGLQRRLVLLPFDKRIENPDLTLTHRLSNDEHLRDSVLSQGLDMVVKVLDHGEFTISKAIEHKTKAWAESLDVASVFISEFLKPSKSSVKFKVVYELYKDYCYTEGASPNSAMRFREQLEAKGYALQKAGGGQYKILSVTVIEDS